MLKVSSNLFIPVHLLLIKRYKTMDFITYVMRFKLQ